MKQRLFDAAAVIVGKLGYSEASIARITEEAGYAQGTFYNHFPSRQALFDELLPSLGLKMAHYVQERTRAVRPESSRELARFKLFFEYLRENPGFLRILNEAEFSAPEAFQKHIDNMVRPFYHMLVRARERGEVRQFTDAEIRVIVHILMGARSYLGQRLDASGTVDTAVFTAYEKMLCGGLFVDG